MWRHNIAVVVAIALGTLAILSPAAVAANRLSGAAECRDRFGSLEVSPVVVCGLSGELRAPHLTLHGLDGNHMAGARSQQFDNFHSGSLEAVPVWLVTAQMQDIQPILPGETLNATWTSLRGSALFYVTVTDPLHGQRPVAITLRKGDRGASITVLEDGSVVTKAGNRRKVLAARPLLPGEPGGPELAPWSASTPREAVQAVLRAGRKGGWTAGATACASRDPAISTLFDWIDVLYEGIPGQLGLVGCSLLQPSSFGDGAHPLLGEFRTVTNFGGKILRVAQLTDEQAAVTARVVINEQEDAFRTRRHTKDARILVVKSKDGLWHLVFPEVLYEVPCCEPDTQLPTVAKLRKNRRDALKDAAGGVEHKDTIAAARQRATVPLGSEVIGCEPLRTYIGEAGDLRLSETGAGPVRDRLMPRADIILASQGMNNGRSCFAIRFATPPPPVYRVWLSLGGAGDSDAVILVKDGTALAFSYGAQDHVADGLIASADGDMLWLSLPLATVPQPKQNDDWYVKAYTDYPYGHGITLVG
jgi:hypothetical protein